MTSHHEEKCMPMGVWTTPPYHAAEAWLATFRRAVDEGVPVDAIWNARLAKANDAALRSLALAAGRAERSISNGRP